VLNLIAAVVLVGIALAQATFSSYMKVNGLHPDLVLILVISWTILRSFEEGLTWALIGGMALDFISGTPFGVSSLAMVLVVVVIAAAQGRVFGSNIFFPLLLVFPLSLLFNGLTLLSLNILGRPVAWVETFSLILFPLALFDTGVTVLIFPLLYWINRRLSPRPLLF
jgi:rod shape-determining protein MreD